MRLHPKKKPIKPLKILQWDTDEKNVCHVTMHGSLQTPTPKEQARRKPLDRQELLPRSARKLALSWQGAPINELSSHELAVHALSPLDLARGKRMQR